MDFQKAVSASNLPLSIQPGISHYIELTYQYRLYAFANYQDVATVRAQLPHVVLAKELSKVKPIGANHYVEHIGREGGYRNYLETNRNRNIKASPLASLITALQILYKVNGYSATYILIARP